MTLLVLRLRLTCVRHRLTLVLLRAVASVTLVLRKPSPAYFVVTHVSLAESVHTVLHLVLLEPGRHLGLVQLLDSPQLEDV